MPPKSDPTVGVICVQCRKHIPVKTVEKVAEDFSVACPKCGKRAIYQIKDLKMMKE